MSYGNRVKETSTSTGVGNLTTAGAVTGFVTFNTTFGLNRPFYYFVLHDTDNTWETGIGHLTASTTFVRNVVLDNSSGGTSAIDFASGGLTLIASPTAGSLPNVPAFPFNGTGANQFLVNEKEQRATTTFTHVIDSVIASPFYTSVGMVCGTMRMEVVTGDAGKLIKWALYRLDQLGDPRQRLASCRTNTIDAGTSGAKTASFDEGSVYIPPGNYLGVFVSDGVPITRATSQSGPLTRYHYMSSDSLGGMNRGLFANSHTFSTAFPEPLAVTWLTSSSRHTVRFVLEP